MGLATRDTELTQEVLMGCAQVYRGIFPEDQVVGRGLEEEL